MEAKHSEFVGVDSCYYALVTQDAAGGYAAGAVKYLAPVAEIAGTPTINNITSYYDNSAAINYTVEGKTELKVTVSNVDAETMAEILGKVFDAVSGRFYDDGEPNPPNVAFGFRYNMGNNEYRYYWYLKGTFSGGSENAVTKKENVEPKPYELTFTAVSTTYEFTVGAATMKLKRVFGDTADAAFSAAGWFDQVQTPDAVGAPDAVALSSIAPNDGTSGVTVSDNIVLTFNNEIESHNVTVIKADGTLVAGAYSWDATGKILTFNPTSNLAGSSTYIVAINGVVDIYGQELAAAAANFETA